LENENWDGNVIGEMKKVAGLEVKCVKRKIDGDLVRRARNVGGNCEKKSYRGFTISTDGRVRDGSTS
jgi:hypothetical protein